jgi:hypothetical protein
MPLASALPLLAEESIWTTIAQFDGLLGAVATWAVAGIIWYKARAKWRSKQFIHVMNFSLNDVRNNALHLRTLFEDTAEVVLGSHVAADQLIAAANETTNGKPFVSMPSDDDWTFTLRACLTVLSEKSAHVYIAQAVGLPVKSATFVFGITCEKEEAVRTRKIRVLLIAKSLLEKHFVPGAPESPDGFQLEHPLHRLRIDTLKRLGELYTSKDPAESRKVRTVELGVPA